MEQNETVIRERSAHTVSRRDIDEDALRVLYRLSQQGYKAYLVGGSVRDLLLGHRPKDFDVGTDAHPREIKRLFRNCFLIGRRFRLAHIKFGSKIIETSTFRRQPDPVPAADGAGHHALLLHRDNTFGTPEEDARRRDFTVNGLFYDIRSFSIIDHVGGLADLEQGLIRSIGDPNIRFREDPVRMLRAVRFASRLGFTIERDAYDAILRHRAEIGNVSPARVFEEIHKLFGFRKAEPAFRLLHRTGLLRCLFPEIADYLDRRGERGFLWQSLACLDRGVGYEGEAPMELRWAALFLPLFRDRTVSAESHGGKVPHTAIVREVLGPCAARYTMPRQMLFRMLRMFTWLRRLELAPAHPRGDMHLAAQEDFPGTLALRFVELAARGESTEPLGAWQALLDRFRQEGLPSRPGSSRDRPARSRGGRRRRRYPRRNRGEPPRDGMAPAQGGSTTTGHARQEHGHC